MNKERRYARVYTLIAYVVRKTCFVICMYVQVRKVIIDSSGRIALPETPPPI